MRGDRHGNGAAGYGLQSQIFLLSGRAGHWAPIIQYVRTFSFSKMWQLNADAISRKIQDAFAAFVNCRTGFYASAIKRLATAFEKNPSQDLLDSLLQVELIPVAKKIFSVNLNADATRRASNYALEIPSDYGLRAALSHTTTHPPQTTTPTTTHLPQTTTPVKSSENKTRPAVGGDDMGN